MRVESRGGIIDEFPAPHLLQAFGFAFQAYFVYEVEKHKNVIMPTHHLSWTSNMIIVIPIAIATSFDIALELNQIVQIHIPIINFTFILCMQI
ncbi:uncharacterized protein [Physcomitrium patens]|uniref:uncharacterized protein isoform X2 n=1 Tax=Physcomitrium patens TaxID=3218 RepID=UPI003CCCABD1